ncbi:MAG: SU10 major capsid protein [Phycisphaerales bacterium]
MSFTGKATYSAGSTLPEIAEDVSDIIAIVSPFETPLLALLGDSSRAATSTVHEWLEDTLLPNTDAVDDVLIGDPATETTFTVENGSRFRVGDQIMLEGKEAERMLVTGVSGNDLTVTRGYGGTSTVSLANDDVIRILGNAALEGADADSARFTNRSRYSNYTQIFAATVEVSGSQLAAQTLSLADEMEFQKAERLRELLRDLENSVINGVAAAANPQGSSTIRRTMRGIRSSIASNLFAPGIGDIPAGGGASSDELNEAVLNAALRAIWDQSAARIDTIVCGGIQKRRINQFISTNQRFIDDDVRYRSMVDVYESDFGICQVVMSRWVPADAVLLLDSSRIDVMPMRGRSFQFKPLATSGDSEVGQVLGEYTLEFRNENAHGIISGLGTSV